jgi:hypothetical protein
VTDASEIPPLWRGYVAVALQKGWLSLDESNKFGAGRPLTRMDLAQAMVVLSR